MVLVDLFLFDHRLNFLKLFVELNVFLEESCSLDNPVYFVATVLQSSCFIVHLGVVRTSRGLFAAGK